MSDSAVLTGGQIALGLPVCLTIMPILSLVSSFTCIPLTVLNQFINNLKPRKMEKTTIKISNPNPYDSKETGTPMVSYVVTGAGAEQYAQDQLAKGYDSKDDNGNPLIHFTAKASVKYGAESTLERSVLADGSVIWFTDNADEKQLNKLIAGADATTQAIFAQEKLAELRAFAKVLASNRSANIAKLQAKNTSKLGDM
jgi:hypothetical protein